MSETEGQAITQKTCLRCGYKWYPRKPGEPLGCGACHSPYWNKPRVYELRNRAPAKSRATGAGTPPITLATTEGNQKGVATADTLPPSPPAVIPTEPPQSAPSAGRVDEALEAYRRMRATQRGEA